MGRKTTKGEKTREKMIEAATRLIRTQGYAATGVQQILQESGAPRGSLYFHFSGGKEEIAAEVVRRHGESYAAAMVATLDQAPTVAAACDLMLTHFAMANEGDGGGCPVAALALEQAPYSEVLRKETRAAFESWTTPVAERLVAEGWSTVEAERRARAAICTLEGAIVLSRGRGDTVPFEDARLVASSILKAPENSR